MIKTTTNTARATIAQGKTFKTSGALSGTRFRSIHGTPVGGMGRGDFPTATRESYYRAIYAVYSYGTPIAWVDGRTMTWVRPERKYSVTTSKHQGQCPTHGTPYAGTVGPED